MGRRSRDRDYDDSSTGSESDDDGDDDRRSGRRGSSRRRRDKSGHKLSRRRDRCRTPEPPPRMPSPTKSKPPKIAMVLLLGPDETEFRLTEAQILFDSPNDLTSTYYADNSGEVKTYRMPDRDSAIFQIIFRYMNREVVLPLRKSLIPRHLSWEQTEQKLAEEAKFYRLTRLMRMLPPPPSSMGSSGAAGHYGTSGYVSGSASVADSILSLSDAHQRQNHLPQTSTPYPTTIPLPPGATPQHGNVTTLLPPDAVQPSLPFPATHNGAGVPPLHPGPAPMQMPMPAHMPPATHSVPSMPTDNSLALVPKKTPHRRRPSSPPAFLKTRNHSHSRRNSRSDLDSYLSRASSPSSPAYTSSRSGSHSRRQSVSSAATSAIVLAAPPPPPPPPPGPPQTVFTYLFKSTGVGLTKNEPIFRVIGFPEDEPLPHLIVKATAAEIKFSAFRSAEDQDIFEIRYSIRILDEPSTRPMAYRVRDTTIKAVDSHLRLNGVITDLECRDIPLQIQHAPPQPNGSGLQRRQGGISDNGNIIADDDGMFTSDFDELLSLMTRKGYVKWPRLWQDTFTNITADESLHQRVCLTSCEVIFDLEFPEEAAAISEAVGGRGFQLNTEEEDDLLLRNYRVNIHGVKAETRKVRRLRELQTLQSHSDEPATATISVPQLRSATGISRKPSLETHSEPILPSKSSVHGSGIVGKLDRMRLEREEAVSEDDLLTPTALRPTMRRSSDTGATTGGGRWPFSREVASSDGLLTPASAYAARQNRHKRAPSYASSVRSAASDARSEVSDDGASFQGSDAYEPSFISSEGQLTPRPQCRSRNDTRVPQQNEKPTRDMQRSRGHPGGRLAPPFISGSIPASPAPSGMSAFSDPVSHASYRSSAQSLGPPASEYSMRPRSTASEEIKRQAMASWRP